MDKQIFEIPFRGNDFNDKTVGIKRQNDDDDDINENDNNETQ